MAILNFPSSPNDGDQYTINDVIYTWDNTQEKWTANNAQDLDARFVNVTGDTMTGNLTVPSLNSGALGGFRNAIINGDFRVWARGEDLSYTGAANDNFGPDRWFIRAPNSVGGATDIDRIQDGAISKCRLTYSAPTNKAFLAQRIESQNIAGLYGQELTLRFNLENISMGTAPTPTVTILSYKSDGTTTSLRAEGTAIDDVDGTQYTLSFTYTTDDGTVNVANGIGLLISININGGNAVSAGACQIWNAQLEPGPVATPLEIRPIGTELALCQRYFQRLFLQGGIVVLKSDADRTTRTPQRLSVRMRATPDAENFIQDEDAVATKEDGTQTTKTAPSAVSPRADDLIEVNNTAQSLSTVRYIGASIDLNAEL